MNKLTARQRNHPTFIQTFHFTDSPTARKPPHLCPHHSSKITDHDVVHSETIEQK